MLLRSRPARSSLTVRHLSCGGQDPYRRGAATPGGRAGDPPASRNSVRTAARAPRLRARSPEDRYAAAHPTAATYRLGSRLEPNSTGDDPPVPVFSTLTDRWKHAPQSSRFACHITHTNEARDRTTSIRENLHRSPLFTAAKSSRVGPRYCPSIEDKVVRFAERRSPPGFRRTGSRTAPRARFTPNGISPRACPSGRAAGHDGQRR